MKFFFLNINSSLIILLLSASAFCQSPYKISWEKDTYILGGGFTAATVGYFVDQSVSPLTATQVNQLSRSSVNRFDRSAIYNFSETADKTSDVLFGIALAAPFALFADENIRNDWKTITLMYTEVWSFIGGTTMLSKGSVQRIRPFVYNTGAPFEKKLTDDARKSFFSGHATAAFASAVFISSVYSDYHPESKWNPYIWGTSLLTATLIGFLRYEAGMHYPTDILTGAVVGSVIGYVIPWMHRADNTTSVTTGMPAADYGISIKLKIM